MIYLHTYKISETQYIHDFYNPSDDGFYAVRGYNDYEICYCVPLTSHYDDYVITPFIYEVPTKLNIKKYIEPRIRIKDMFNSKMLVILGSI